jgi:hypothetical protein
LVDTVERATAIRTASELREPHVRTVLQQAPNGVHEVRWRRFRGIAELRPHGVIRAHIPQCSPRADFAWHLRPIDVSLATNGARPRRRQPRAHSRPPGPQATSARWRQRHWPLADERAESSCVGLRRAACSERFGSSSDRKES